MRWIERQIMDLIEPWMLIENVKHIQFIEVTMFNDEFCRKCYFFFWNNTARLQKTTSIKCQMDKRVTNEKENKNSNSK